MIGARRQASGPILRVRLIEELLNSGEQVCAVVSKPPGRDRA